MDIVINSIADWLKSLFAGNIIFYLERMFDALNPVISAAGNAIAQSPDQWQPSVFNLVQQLSEAVIMPVAGIILTALACYELIHMIISRNGTDFDTFIIFKWMFKTAISVMILSNAFAIVMGIFDVTQSVVTYASGIVDTNASLSAIALDDYYDTLMALDVWELWAVNFQVTAMYIVCWFLSFIVYIIIFGRMLEIYLLTSLAPIPLATLTAGNHQINIGINYLKSILALGFQGFLMVVCIGIYVVLLQSITALQNPMDVGWSSLVFSGFLCYGLFQTGRLTKTVFGAHG